MADDAGGELAEGVHCGGDSVQFFWGKMDGEIITHNPKFGKFALFAAPLVDQQHKKPRSIPYLKLAQTQLVISYHRNPCQNSPTCIGNRISIILINHEVMMHKEPHIGIQ